MSIYKTSQDTYDLSRVKELDRVAIKLSGGADSAAVGLMLWDTIHNTCPDTDIVVCTTRHQGKVFQEDHSRAVMNWLCNKFPNVKVHSHLINQNPAYKIEDEPNVSIQYVKYQEYLMDYCYDELGVHGHFSGITRNPPKEVYEQFRHKPETDDGSIMKGPTDDRDSHDEKRPQLDWGLRKIWTPLVNTDKKGVAEIMDLFNAREELFPLTWSCELYTWPEGRHDEHCDDCWFCKERLWGFGSYK